MTEKYDEQLILGYVEGELTPAQETRFRKLMGSDPRLHQLVDGLVSDRQALRQATDEPLPDDLVDRVVAVMERDMLLEPTSTQRIAVKSVRRHYFRRIVAYSGLAAMLLISGLLVVYTLTDSQFTHQTAMTTSKGEVASVAPKSTADVKRSNGLARVASPVGRWEPDRSQEELRLDSTVGDVLAIRSTEGQEDPSLESLVDEPNEEEADRLALLESESATRFTAQAAQSGPGSPSAQAPSPDQPSKLMDSVSDGLRTDPKLLKEVSVDQLDKSQEILKGKKLAEPQATGKETVIADKASAPKALVEADEDPLTLRLDDVASHIQSKQKSLVRQGRSAAALTADRVDTNLATPTLAEPNIQATLRIATHDTLQSRLSLMAWIAGHAHSDPVRKNSRVSSASTGQDEDSRNNKPSPSVAWIRPDAQEAQLTFYVDARQIPQLLADLNKPEKQSATLVYRTPPLSWLRAVDADPSGVRRERGQTTFHDLPHRMPDTADSRDTINEKGRQLTEAKPSSIERLGTLDWDRLLDSRFPLGFATPIPPPHAQVEIRVLFEPSLQND